MTNSWPGVGMRPLLGILMLVLCVACSGTADVSSLQQRIRALEDEAQIREVLVQYGEYLDARDYPAYASLFAKDGTWTGGLGSATGPAAIQAMLEGFLGKPAPGAVNRNSFHLITTMVVKVDGDTATARSRYMFYTATPENRPGAVIAGRYVDEFVREDGHWKIRRRTTQEVIPWRE